MCRKFCRLILVVGLSQGFLSEPARADDAKPFDHKVDVVYGRKYGMALTMDIFTPKANANGAAIVSVMSGGWFSSHDWINPGSLEELLKRGYTVFAVVHGSQPRFTIPEVVKDMNRAVRFIRFHAKDYHIDPDRIGITGGSAGGHLSLMQGTAGDTGDKSSKDPIDRPRAGFKRSPASSHPRTFSTMASPARLPWVAACSRISSRHSTSTSKTPVPRLLSGSQTWERSSRSVARLARSTTSRPTTHPR